MSYTKQSVIFDVPLSEVQIGVIVGFEIEFSNSPYFSPLSYAISTFREDTGISDVFFYSTDDLIWSPFPQSGRAFFDAYKLKLIINSSDTSYIFAEKYGTIYRIRGDGESVIESYQIGSFDSTGFDINSQTNELYVTGQNKTAYVIDTHDVLHSLDAGNSINLLSNPLSISLDPARNSLWQIDRRSVALKTVDGDLLSNFPLPFDIDVDWSSSSDSSSSDSSSSSSSTEVMSSSSSLQKVLCMVGGPGAPVGSDPAIYGQWNDTGTTWNNNRVYQHGLNYMYLWNALWYSEWLIGPVIGTDIDLIAFTDTIWYEYPPVYHDPIGAGDNDWKDITYTYYYTLSNGECSSTSSSSSPGP